MGRKLTNEEFILRGTVRHNGKYNYSKFEYINSYTKGIIICPVHGEFLQRSDHHLEGEGCPKCGVCPAKTLEQFINEANKVHGQYIYTKFKYINSSIKGIIICPIHGEFLQTPSSHLQGNGCPKCAICALTKTVEEFIIEAYEIHGQYDYSNFKYVNFLTKGIIICPIHGEFWQNPSHHLQGNGCPLCVGKNKTTDIFIIEANIKHNNKYDYAKFKYINSRTKSIIICPIHGEFLQIPNSHLQGMGCSKCGGKSLKSRDMVINEANKIHGQYIYTDFVYINTHTKSTIICPKHGKFLQTPQSHLQGNGCPKCCFSYSKKCHKWIDSFNNKNIIKGYRIKIKGFKRTIEFDGYDPITNTVYEFYGDEFHGNPEVYNLFKISSFNKNKTYRELYEYTMNREKLIKQAGYKLITIWEKDWDELAKKEKNEKK